MRSTARNPLPTTNDFLVSGVEAMMAKLDMSADSVNIGLAGDSTGNEATEWATLMLALLGARYTDRAITTRYWNATTHIYSGDTTIQAGVAPNIGVVGLDSFSRTASELRSSTPEVGQPWTTSFGSASGEWTIDGAAAVRSAVAATGQVYLLETGRAGRMRCTLDMAYSSSPGASARSFRFGFFKDDNNYLFVGVTANTSGTVSYNIVKRIAGANTVVGTGATSPMPSSTAVNDVQFALDWNGTSVSARVGAGTVSGTLTSDDVTALTGATKFYMNSDVAAGDKVKNVFVEQVQSSTAPTLKLYNASIAGSILSDQQSYISTMFPASVYYDLLFVNTSHNYGDKTPAQYQAALDSWIDAFRALHPEAGIVLMSQNPRKAPAYNAADHAKRLASLRGYATRHKYGYVPVHEAWLQQPNQGLGLVQPDGIHPTQGTPNTGSSFWAQQVYDYLVSQSLRP